ncbi:hypothetical protein [Novosphingobium sp. Fuku2-ISO-50]|uniref:hypothetical protein n=1 Tax=Novosphingobium sp. Fuku2-ISO-50 TaxID=1739114 RepID=UPI000AFB48A1|nr:hypothetical protein [Novosphingobium sp. Fuku2-ISO-50]
MFSPSHHERQILEKASEDNPNNSREPNRPWTKAYCTCLAVGWIEVKMHAQGGYYYFAITEAGEAALRAPRPPKAPKAPKKSRLKMAEMRLKAPELHLGRLR